MKKLILLLSMMLCTVMAAIPVMAAPTLKTDLPATKSISKDSEITLSAVFEDAVSYQWYCNVESAESVVINEENWCALHDSSAEPFIVSGATTNTIHLKLTAPVVAGVSLDGKKFMLGATDAGGGVTYSSATVLNYDSSLVLPKGEFLTAPEGGTTWNDENYSVYVKVDRYFDPETGNELPFQGFSVTRKAAYTGDSDEDYSNITVFAPSSEGGDYEIQIGAINTYKTPFVVNAWYGNTYPGEILSVSEPFTITWNPKYTVVSINEGQLQPVGKRGLAAGTPKTKIGLGLPDTIPVQCICTYVDAVNADGTVRTLSNTIDVNVNVTWDVEHCEYDPLKTDAGQGFIVQGSFTWPDEISPYGTGEYYTEGYIEPVCEESRTVEKMPTLESIKDFEKIEGVVNGAAKTVTGLGLPKKTTLVIKEYPSSYPAFESDKEASVTWDVAHCDYDPSDKTEQKFTVDGTVTLPDGIDQNGVSLDVTIDVTVLKEKQVAAVTSNPKAGEYKKNTDVKLVCATEGAEIYYTLDGSTPSTSSTKYTKEISMVGTNGISVPYTIKAIAVKEGYVNSPVSTLEYTIKLPAIYNITINSSGNGSASANVTKAAVGDTVTLTTNGNSGYIFSNWTSSGTNVTIKNNKFTMPEGEVVLTANFKKAQTFTVRFVMNGHGSSIDPQYVQEESKVNKPSDPSANGYSFGGWYKDSGCSDKYDFNSKVTSNLTLYAKWSSGSSSSTSTTTTNYFGTNTSTLNGTTTPNFVYQQTLADLTVMCTCNGNSGEYMNMKGYGTDPKNIQNQYFLANSFMNTLLNMDAACFDTVDLYSSMYPLGGNDGTNQIIVWKGTKCPAGTVYGVVWNPIDKAYIIPGVCDASGTVTFPNFKLRSQSTLTICIPIQRSVNSTATTPAVSEKKVTETTETTETTTTTGLTTEVTTNTKTNSSTSDTKSKSYSTTVVP